MRILTVQNAIIAEGDSLEYGTNYKIIISTLRGADFLAPRKECLL